METATEIVIHIFAMLGGLVAFFFVLWLMFWPREKEVNEHYDKLIQQEQMDRIEDMVKELETEWCTDERHRNYGHKSILIENNKDNVKTNIFNNQFIAQNLEDETKLQCVVCSSFDTERIKTYESSKPSEINYVCHTCENQYTVE